MSNFWFNDDGFNMGLQNNGESMGMFDDLDQAPLQHPATPNQQLQQQQQSQQPSQQVDGLFGQQDYQQFGGYAQKQSQPPLDAKSQQMYMRQDDNMSIPLHMPTQAPAQHTPGQQHTNLDRAKQEQLQKMRQQIVQQHMLQKQLQNQNQQSQQSQTQQFQQQYQQQQQQQQQSLQYQLPQVQPLQLQAGATSGSMMGHSGPQVPPAHQGIQGPGPQGPQGQAQIAASAMLPAAMGADTNTPSASSQYGGPGLGQDKTMPMAPGQAQLKLSHTQMAQLQHELFQMTLNDFMSRRGTPITQTPVVNNKRINLLVLHILTRKIGGASVVLKHLQMLSQPSLQVTDWTTVCQKLGLFDGIDILSNLAAKLQIEKQLGTCYLQNILPYEQHTLTEEGQKDIQARRVQFQRQLALRLQQNQQRLAAAVPGQSPQLEQNQTQQAPGQQGLMQNAHQRPMDSTNSPNPNQKLGQFQSPNAPSQSPRAGYMATPGALNQASPATSVTNLQRKASQPNGSNHTSPAVNSPYMQQQQISRSGSVNRRQSSINLQQFGQRHESSVTPQTQEPDVPSGDPNTIKKYVPIKKAGDTFGGLSMKTISDLGDEIELTKPVYLFAPELGSLNIHALTMSLRNYSENNPGEAFSALNTLLVTTTDSNFTFKVSDAPELLDTLVSLGSKILGQVTNSRKPESDNINFDFDTKSDIDSVFAKYVNKNSMNGEDIVLVVDSLTAEVVEDEDSDMEMDEIFSPQVTTTELVASHVEDERITLCTIPDFLTALQKFREENKYHFSKTQTKSATDQQVFLVDMLITVTMTLRNLSFTDGTRGVMSSHKGLKSLIFGVVKGVAVQPESFQFERKKLCVLKDCLLILDRIAFQMELDSLEEAFLAFLLVTSFGPKLDSDESDSSLKFAFPIAPFETYTYLPYGIDVFTKLLVREPRNRAYLQAILTGTLNIINSSSHPSSASVTISPKDHHETKKLLKAYLGGNEEKAKLGILLTRAFKFLISGIPCSVSGVEYTRFVFQRSSTVLQTLFGVKLLIDLIPMEEVNGNLTLLTTHWLSSNVQKLFFNFIKNTFSLITESVKFAQTTNEHRILSYVAIKTLILINSLLANAVTLKSAISEGELSEEKTADIEDHLAKFKDLYRVQPEGEFVLNTLLASSIDPDVAQEVVRLHGLLGKLR